MFVSMTARSALRKRYPKEMARLMWVVIAPGENSTAPTKPARYMTWCNEKDFSSAFYFSDIRSGKIDLEITIEGSEPLWISELTAHAWPDVIYREFEHGIVLANPSPRAHTFKLDELFVGKKFRRIKATANQDTSTNNGHPVSKSIILGPKDALFLVKEN
jgi:hypothetical protein